MSNAGSVRITFVATDLSTGGGVNRAIRDIATILTDRVGAQVTVVEARATAAPTYPFHPQVRVHRRRRASIMAYAAAIWSARRSRPDYVVGSWTQDNILLALLFFGSASKTILVEHSSWCFQPTWVRLLRNLIYRSAWRVIVLNPTELAYYRRFLSNVRLLPNPVGPGENFQEGDRDKLILAIGHLEPNKGFSDALRAVAAASIEDDGWSLVIIGQGTEQRNLEALIVQLGLRSTSIHPPTADLSTWYNRASLIVVTSRMEVFSLVLAEAMTAGVIPIAYATDGPAFILEDFPDQLVPIGDVRALAERLRRVIRMADPGLRAKLRASIQRRFAAEVIATKWKELLA